jgi:hypothetical protein
MINRAALQVTTNALKINPVTLVTGIKYSASMVKKFNNMTFLYDPNWEYEQGNPTYPIAFFFLKSISEQMSSDVSTKPMLFYNAGTESKDATAGGLMNIVADNIIVRPKEYKLEVVIPANGSALNDTLYNFGNTSAISMFIATGTELPRVNAIRLLEGVTESVFTVMDVLLKSLYGAEINAQSILQSMLQQQDYNKASIEYMWKSRRVLKLKMWNGWKFKYLVIKDCDVTKNGEDGDFYTATLNCQELPVLTFRNQEKSALTALQGFSSELGKLQKSVVDRFINAMSATYTTSYGSVKFYSPKGGNT